MGVGVRGGQPALLSSRVGALSCKCKAFDRLRCEVVIRIGVYVSRRCTGVVIRSGAMRGAGTAPLGHITKLRPPNCYGRAARVLGGSPVSESHQRGSIAEHRATFQPPKLAQMDVADGRTITERQVNSSHEAACRKSSRSAPASSPNRRARRMAARSTGGI